MTKKELEEQNRKQWLELSVRYKRIKYLEKSLSLAELGWEQVEEESNKLRQSLKECQIENEDLAKAWNTLKDFNDNTDNKEDEEIGELKEKLAKSEERVKEGCRKISDLIDENTELLEDTDAEDKYDLLKQVLIKEWKG